MFCNDCGGILPRGCECSPFGGRLRREPTKVEPGSELHLTLLMAPHGLNLVVGDDRQRLLAYARDVWAAAQQHASGARGDGNG